MAAWPVSHHRLVLQLGTELARHLRHEHASDVLLAIRQLALDLAVQALQVARHLRSKRRQR